MAQGDIITPPIVRVGAPKPKMTVYYALLIIALCAMLVACLFMYLEIRRFGGFGTVKGRISSVDRPAPPLVVHEQCRVGRVCETHHALGITIGGSRRFDPPYDYDYDFYASAGAAGSVCRPPSSRSRSNSAAGSSFTS